MEFKIKTAEELEAMETNELVKYFNDLNAHKNEELVNLTTKLKEDASEELKKEVDALKAEINAANVEQMKTLQKALEEQGLALKQLMSEKTVTAVNKLHNILEDNKDAIAKASTQNPFTFTINKADVLTTSVTNPTANYMAPGIGEIARPVNVLRQLFLTGTVSAGQGGVVHYIDQATNTNGAAMQTEGALKGEGAITWVEKSMPLQTVAEWIQVSKQALTDFAFIESEIKNKLLRDLAFKVEDEVWDGTGVAPELKGIYTAADTYTAVASGITDANIYDLIVKVQENIAGDTNYMPNVAVMHITDINKMKLKKDANNNYILPPFVSQDGTQVSGITVVASSQVTANTMLVGDFNYATLYSLGSVEVTVGWQNDNMTKNMVTILAEERLGLLVRDVEADAFNKVTDIAAALVTLAT